MKNQILLWSFLLFSFAPFLLQSQGQIIVDGPITQTTITSVSATVVAPSLTITATENISDFTISITDSYSTNDAIGYTGILPVGITTTGWNASKRSMVFKGTKTAAEWQVFLRGVTITTANVCSPETRKVSFIAGETFYNPLNGHFYKVTSTSSNWLPAKTAAASNSYYGNQGYLATITSIAENTFVSRLIGQNAWMGASDDYLEINEAVGYTLYSSQGASEGKWYWVTGPEKGTQMSTANQVNISTVYQNWGGGEPNNAGNEHCLHMYASSGLWNDFANSQTIFGIVEYGDLPGDYTQSNPRFTKDIYIQGSSSGSITGGNVTVCAGTNATTLTLGNFTGSVVRWESSLDNFITSGTSIANTTATLTVSNISTTTYYRAVVNSTSPTTCNGLVTSSAPVYVSSAVSGNVFAVNTSICAGSDVELYLSGQDGEVQKWQRSTNNSTWTDIADTNTTLIETIASIGTMYYRAHVQVIGCGAAVITPSKSITVVSGTAPQGGSVSSNTHFSAANSGTLTLTGYTGTITKWQKSTDDGLVWINVVNTNNTHDYSNITTETLFRVLVENGSCGSSYSTVGTVNIVYTPTISEFNPTIAIQGQEVIITGTNLENVTQVQFGGIDATSFVINSTSQITAIVASSGASGSVTVTNTGGSDSLSGFIFNAAPTDIAISISSIIENNTLNEIIGTLSAIDADVLDTHSYTLVAGGGDNNNADFLISGTNLQSNAIFDYEIKSDYSIRIEVQDNAGNTYEKIVNISISDENESPTDISLSNNSIIENTSIGTVVGVLGNADSDTGNIYTYTLANGNGSNDTGNTSFVINGINLELMFVPDYETQTSYPIYVNVNDGANDFQKAFVVNITDVNEDVDNDGVSNDLDQCDNTPTGETVDANGCADTQKDTDSDGVNDAIDQCDNTPIGETVDANGCSDSQKDADNDGVINTIDNCVSIANTDQVDTDLDGEGDVCDSDDDGDGTPDTEDDFPLDKNEDRDTDEDGTGDNADTDDDGDGTADSEDVFPLDPTEDTDTDNDGIGDYADTDDDGDGSIDTDTDGDGIGNNVDLDDDNDGTLDFEDAFATDPNEDLDTDGDGTGDNADLDDDNDGYSDEVEDREGTDSKSSASTPEDTDGDGISDSVDLDDDNDGIIDTEDSFPKKDKPVLKPAEAFTPNGDGINDSWVIPGINNYPNSIVTVYNRWGHEVFKATGYRNNWNGNYNSNSEKLPPGSYMYVIDLGNGATPIQHWLFINY